MSRKVFETAAEALAATNSFYEENGFAYTDEQVRDLLRLYIRKWPERGNVLDLCCGDGIWSRGIKELNPKLSLFGIDIAEAGVQRARSRLPEDRDCFVVGDVERQLPWPDGTFDLIFARGPGLYNQHSMDRPATIRVIESWHRALRPSGVFVSVFFSNPELFGTYTNPLKVALPYNRAPRLSDAVDFTGGKYHHDTTSFLAPFRKAESVKLGEYRFVRNHHILETTLVPSGRS